MALSLDYINQIIGRYDASGKLKRGALWRQTNMSYDAKGRAVPLKTVPGLDDSRLNAAGSYYSFAKTLLTIIYTYVHREINSFPMDALSIGEFQLEPVETSDGKIRGYRRYVDILVNRDYLWRDSLWNTSNVYKSLRRNWQNNRGASYWDATRRKYGISDIILLFEHGWTATGRVRGVWHGKSCWNRVSAPGRYMLNEAIAFFNRTTPKAISAKVGPAYRSRQDRS